MRVLSQYFASNKNDFEDFGELSIVRPDAEIYSQGSQGNLAL
jgi:hypothetical protein